MKLSVCVNSGFQTLCFPAQREPGYEATPLQVEVVNRTLFGTYVAIISDVARIYKVYLNNLYWAQSYSPGKEDSNDTQFVKIGLSVLELHIKT